MSRLFYMYKLMSYITVHLVKNLINKIMKKKNKITTKFNKSCEGSCFCHKDACLKRKKGF